MAEEPAVRDQLMEGVREHIRVRGATNLTVRALAAAAGRSTMCVYTRFDGRKGLLTAAYQHVAGEFLGVLDTADPVGAYAAYAEAEPHLYALLFEADFTALDLDPELRRNLLLAVIERFGADGSEAWAGLHGRIFRDRLLGSLDEVDRAVAS